MADEPGKPTEADTADKGKTPIAEQNTAPAAAEDVDDPDFDDLDGEIVHTLPIQSIPNM